MATFLDQQQQPSQLICCLKQPSGRDVACASRGRKQWSTVARSCHLHRHQVWKGQEVLSMEYFTPVLNVSGVPIGSPGFVENWLEKKVDEISEEDL